MAANKADEAAVLSVREEIEQLLGDDMPEGNSKDQKFLKQVLALFNDKNKVSDADWEDLSEATQNWVGDAADAFKSKEALPPLPELAEEEAPEVEKETKKSSKSKKAAKKVAAEVEVEAVEEEENEQEEAEASAVDSDESSSGDDLVHETETQGKESEVATNKKRGTKAAKSAKAKDTKPQKRAATPVAEDKSAKKAAGKTAGKAKTNGHARGASGVDTVFELTWKHPKASVESVIEKAKAAGVKTSETQIGTLYNLARKNIDIAVKLGKIEV